MDAFLVSFWAGSVSIAQSPWRRSGVRSAVPEQGKPRAAPCWKSTAATVAISGWRCCRPRSSSTVSCSCSRSIAPWWRRMHQACSESGRWLGWPCSSSAFCKGNAVLPRSMPARASRRSSASWSRRQPSWKGLPCLHSCSPSSSAAESRKDEMIMAEAQGTGHLESAQPRRRNPPGSRVSSVGCAMRELRKAAVKPMRSSPRHSNRPPTWSRPPSGKRK